VKREIEEWEKEQINQVSIWGDPTGNESATKLQCDYNASGVLDGGGGTIWSHVKVRALPRAAH